MDKVAAVLALLIMVAVIAHMGGGSPPPVPRPLPTSAPPSADDRLRVGAGVQIKVVNMKLSVDDGELNVASSFSFPTAVGTLGLEISPHRVRWLYVRLGNQTRAYNADGYIKVYIPNSLSGRSTFEWGDDYGLIVIPDPAGLHFPPGGVSVGN